MPPSPPANEQPARPDPPGAAEELRLANARRDLAVRGSNVGVWEVNMPELDGFQVIRALGQREQAAGGHLPVVALTARSMKGDRERCLEAGMDDYLAKPIRAADFLAIVHRVAGTSSAASPPALLDCATLLAASDGDEGLLRKMCQTFQVNVPVYLARVQEAIRAGNAAALREAAHKLKGLLSTFSTAAAEPVQRLEDRGPGGQLDGGAEEAAGLAGMLREVGRHLVGLSVEELKRRSALIARQDFGRLLPRPDYSFP